MDFQDSGDDSKKERGKIHGWFGPRPSYNLLGVKVIFEYGNF